MVPVPPPSTVEGPRLTTRLLRLVDRPIEESTAVKRPDIPLKADVCVADDKANDACALFPRLDRRVLSRSNVATPAAATWAGLDLHILEHCNARAAPTNMIICAASEPKAVPAIVVIVRAEGVSRRATSARVPRCWCEDW